MNPHSRSIASEPPCSRVGRCVFGTAQRCRTPFGVGGIRGRILLNAWLVQAMLRLLL
jgi:hypothetical protein